MHVSALNKGFSKEKSDHEKESLHAGPPGRTEFGVDFRPHQSPGSPLLVLHPLLFCPVSAFFLPNTRTLVTVSIVVLNCNSKSNCWSGHLSSLL